MTLRSESQRAWNPRSQSPTLDEVNAGSLQRIADAVETMSGSYQRLIDERDRYKRWFNDERKRRQAIERSNAALRGQITKLRGRLESLQ